MISIKGEVRHSKYIHLLYPIYIPVNSVMQSWNMYIFIYRVYILDSIFCIFKFYIILSIHMVWVTDWQFIFIQFSSINFNFFLKWNMYYIGIMKGSVNNLRNWKRTGNWKVERNRNKTKHNNFFFISNSFIIQFCSLAIYINRVSPQKIHQYLI